MQHKSRESLITPYLTSSSSSSSSWPPGSQQQDPFDYRGVPPPLSASSSRFLFVKERKKEREIQ